MPRFVAKEDVQKGLVDPTKPLCQQPDYQKKLEQQHKQKQPKEEPQKHENQKHESQKNENKQKKPRRQREDRPQFNWNKKQITLETKVPEAPKKIIPKPDNQKFKAEFNKLKELKDSLYEQRKKLIEQQKYLIKSNAESKTSGFTALSKYGLELKQKNSQKRNLFDKINKLEQQRKNIENELKALKDQNATLIKPRDLELMSTEQLKDRISELEHKLSTANLQKKQETQINNNINLAKRALIKSRSDIQIKTEISKNDDKIKILTDESRALKKQIDVIYKYLKPIKAEIQQLLKKRKQQEGTITQVKSVEEIRADYDKKIKQTDAKREEAQKKMDELRNKYYKQLDLYEDQQDLLRYIKYVQEEIDYKRKRKQEDERRQKEKEEKQLKKKKEFEQRQKRREERKKQQEERKQREQQRKKKLQAQRQAYINKNPNWQTIELCEFMIKYCENIRPEAQKPRNKEDKNIKPEEINLKQQKGWEKQVKSGCEVIVGKKNKVDEQATKKTKKEKKPKAEQNSDSFVHGIDTINRFHDLNILPPANTSEIDQTIKQLQDKIQILNKPSEQAIEAFKIKAAKEFDRINGFGEEEEQHEESQKAAKHENKRERVKKVELQGGDFPELN